MGKKWWEASRVTSGQAPNPATTREAVLQVYAARAFSWRGCFGVHTWIATKLTNSNFYIIYQIVGWRLRNSETALVIERDIPDRLWYNAIPDLLLDLRGSGIDEVINQVDTAARSYPYANKYTVWPGPNSNTFTSWIARRVPELKLKLPTTAIGKDWLGADGPIAKVPNGTGYQFSMSGLVGISFSTDDGMEVNIAGLSFGLDLFHLAIRLPCVGRIGLSAATASRILRNIRGRE